MPFSTLMALLVPARERLVGQNGLTFQWEAVGQERKCQDRISLAWAQEGEEQILSSQRENVTSHQRREFGFPVPS